jgi:hypothetical protein
MTRECWWSAIDVRILPSGKVQVLTPIVYYFKSGLRLYVEQGLVCDLASTGRIPGLPNKIRSSPGAILHDDLYKNAERHQAYLLSNGWANVVVDQQFSDLCARIVWRQDRNMGAVWSWVYWAAVSGFGERAWNGHREAARRAARSASHG